MAYLFDRGERWDPAHWRQWLFDLPVVALALSRALAPVPFVSGHALFLTYALLTLRLRIAWWISACVFAEVVYIKVFVLHDPTLIGGIVIGALAAWLAREASRRYHLPIQKES